MQKPNIGRELLDVPMGDMIRDMAFAIADAQLQLDANSVEVAQMLGGLKQIIGADGRVTFADSRVYFGQEKVKMLDAIDMYNASNDPEFRARILSGLDSLFYTFDCVATYKTFTALQNAKDLEEGTFYELKDEEAFRRYDGIDEKFNKIITDEIPNYKVPIKKTAKVSGDSFILLPQRISMLELGFSPTFYQFVDTIIEVKMSISYTQSESYSSSSSTTTGSSTTNSSSSSKNSSSSGGVNSTTTVGTGGLLSFFGVKASNTTSIGHNYNNSNSSTNSCSSTSVRATSVNASYSQKFSYSAEGASLLRTKLVPIPPPAILEERIRALMEVAKENSASGLNIDMPEETNNEE